MTQNIFFDALIIFLIAYAIIDIFYEISEYLLNRFSRISPKDYIVLPLYHGDENLECSVRFAVKRSKELRCFLVIVKNNLDENEKMILCRLAENLCNVVILTQEEFAQQVCENQTIIPPPITTSSL